MINRGNGFRGQVTAGSLIFVDHSRAIGRPAEWLRRHGQAVFRSRDSHRAAGFSKAAMPMRGSPPGFCQDEDGDAFRSRFLGIAAGTKRGAVIAPEW